MPVSVQIDGRELAGRVDAQGHLITCLAEGIHVIVAKATGYFDMTASQDLAVFMNCFSWPGVQADTCCAAGN